MRRRQPTAPGRILTILAGVLVLRVLASIVGNYGDYLPPDFTSDFLRGREGYFRGGYRWAFYAHIASGPVALALGLVLVSETARAWSPRWHRRLGWFQVASVLLLVTPSGLWMARHAAAGPIGATGLATLAVATAACATLGTRAALRRRFIDHRRWMWRCYLLLASAVVLRLIGGLATVAEWNAPWFDPMAAWASWITPLAVFEIRERRVAGTPPRSVRERADGLAAGDRSQGA